MLPRFGFTFTVDLARFAPADGRARATARDRLGVGPQVPLAVRLGRVTRQKGQDLLRTAWPAVRRRCPEAGLRIVGDGGLLPRLRNRVAPGVRFAAPVTDPRPWYAAADVVMLPSCGEGLPLTLLEALASGCPVVVADIPGLAEAVTADVGPGCQSMTPRRWPPRGPRGNSMCDGPTSSCHEEVVPYTPGTSVGFKAIDEWAVLISLLA